MNSLRQKVRNEYEKGARRFGRSLLMDEQGNPFRHVRNDLQWFKPNSPVWPVRSNLQEHCEWLLSPNLFTDNDVVRLSRMCKYPINISTPPHESQAQNRLGNLSWVTMTENGIA